MARKAAGDELEARVAGELTARGWAVSCWGQGALAAAVAASLRRTDSALRWAPDLLAAAGDLVVMIDCKASMTSCGTGRHAVERAAVRAHLQFTAIFDLPFYYVFDNLGVLTPMDVRAAGQAGPYSRVGSGAPYYLVSTALDRDFSDVFGPGPCKARGAARQAPRPGGVHVAPAGGGGAHMCSPVVTARRLPARPGMRCSRGPRKLLSIWKPLLTVSGWAMARGSGSSGSSYSYRQWAAAERAAEQDRQRKEKQAEKDRQAAEAAARDEEAAARTEAVEQRAAELGSVLRSSLGRDPRVRFDSLRISAAVPPLDLGPLANPVPAPQWADFQPAPPGALGRIFGGGQRYQDSVREAEQAFAAAQADCQRREAARQRGIAAARAEWARAADEAKRRADAHNAHIAETEAGFRARDRFAVSEYVQAVLDRSPCPEGFPAERYAGYVPESSLLAVKWFLPAFDVIPGHKAFRHVKARKAVEPVARPPAEAQRLYTAVIAQVAVRTVREVFTVTPPDMVSTVVFTGHVDTVDPATGQKTQPPLISMRATREKFDELVLAEPRFDPVASIKRHFFAAISQHPEELKPVDPVMPFSQADPRVVEAIDVISTLDQRPNLLGLSPEAFESFVQNLFTKMGYETDRYRSSRDGGIDCMAYKRDPVAPMKIAVQAKLYTKTVSPTHVRDLYGTMQHEGATLGIMITTSGYGPGSVEFANGKPLHLIDGPGLISICQENDIPARILGLGTRKRKP